ncbi:glycosyltransferase family 4 protein [Pseudomonas marginalis]|uniref:glycosyltransferase family 4 protein n=1 Tax=Pseudomonas marginalis TaxID=298 RepID=UPI003B9FEA26
MNKLKILTFSSYYVPGYKGGGPVRTIENMVAHLDDSLEFWIVTRNHDLGDTIPYHSIQHEVWQRQGNAYVYYLPAEKLNLLGIRKIIKSTPHDIVYLNSFFDCRFTIFPLLYRYLSRDHSTPFVLAPRGEFSSAALEIKKIKKKLYIAISQFLRLSKNLTFQASSEFEANDIEKALGIDKSEIKIASDLPSVNSPSPASLNLHPPHQTEESSLRVIFLSRISPMKNLDFAISILAETTCSLQFDIYGPKEDLPYWAHCEQLLSSLPDHIQYNYCGTVMPDDVREIFSAYDLFLFPTQGENYGHVIAESISAGTPVLLSDRTPWRSLEQDNLGWVLPLGAPQSFARVIDACSKTTPQEKQEKRRHILDFSEHKLCAPESIIQNRELFVSLLPQNK